MVSEQVHLLQLDRLLLLGRGLALAQNAILDPFDGTVEFGKHPDHLVIGDDDPGLLEEFAQVAPVWQSLPHPGEHQHRATFLQGLAHIDEHVGGRDVDRLHALEVEDDEIARREFRFEVGVELQALFIVMLVASHPSIIEHPQAAEAARDTESYLVETARLAAQDPATLKIRQPEWQRLAKRLNLLVDDVSIHGANLATTDLGQMAGAMREARHKLLLVLLLVGGFLLLLLFLLRKHLVRPLQRIDRALSNLGVDRPEPEFPNAYLAEIHAVETATKRLHKAMVSNEAARHELELLANRDGLTGLMNRRHFMVSAEAEVRRAQRYERPIAVALGDLDFFKRLNDTYGHGAGDVVLRSFAALLLDSVRQSDLVCRYGGEEFAFLFPESSVEQAHTLVERFRQRFSEHDVQLPSGLLVRITLSVGLADASRCPLEIALQRADYALYEAKRLGRNRLIVAAEPD